MINSAHESFYLALTLWGYTDSSAPDAARPADWERARLGLQAGRFLALHTRRPGSSPHPPTELPSGTDPRVQDGWIRLKGWRRIVGRTQGPVRLDPDMVVGRMVGRSASTTATGLRQLLDNTTRLLRYPEGLPDGVALTIGAPHLPDTWWGYVGSGWLAGITGDEQLSPLAPLPRMPEKHRTLAEALKWLAAQPDLAEVSHALRAGQAEAALDAAAMLGYDRPELADREQRTVLARTLSLYAAALTGDCRDQEVVDLVGRLCAEAGLDTCPAPR